MSVAILFIIPTNKSKLRGTQFYPINQVLFWTTTNTVILLTWIGARPVEDPYILKGQILTTIYFVYYIVNPIIHVYCSLIVINFNTRNISSFTHWWHNWHLRMCTVSLTTGKQYLFAHAKIKRRILNLTESSAPLQDIDRKDTTLLLWELA